MRSQFIALAAVLLIASPAYADIAVDPCEGAAEGAECALDSGGTGVCTKQDDGSMTCAEAAAGTNNATNNAANNGTAAGNNGTAAANNETAQNNGTGSTAGGSTAATTGGEKAESEGCSTAGAGGLVPSLLAFAMLFGLRRRR